MKSGRISLPIPLEEPLPLRRIAGVALVSGALLALWPVLVRAGRDAALRDIAPWLAGLAIVAGTLLAIDLARGLVLRRPAATSLALLLAPTMLSLALTLPDLTDPYYSAIGDEYSFFERARDIAGGLDVDPFSQRGVFNRHPNLSSVFQRDVMAVAGVDQFGWRLSSALSLALGALAMTALGWLTGGRWSGLTAGLIIAAAHPMLAFAHIGYNNIQALPLTAGALALALWSRRTDSRALILLAGVTAGLGWYTFYLSRIAIAVVLLITLLQPGWKPRLRDLLLALAGFALAVLPLVAASRDAVLTDMLAESAAQSGAPLGELLPQVAAATLQTLQAPWRNSTASHFITGALLDPLSQVLVIGGLIVGLASVFRRQSRLWLWVWVWLGLALLAGGGASQYAFVPNTRSFFVLPPLALFAGLFVAWAASESQRSPSVARGFVAAAAVAGIAVVGLNVYRFKVETPSRLVITPEAIAIGQSEQALCRTLPGKPLFLSATPEPLLQKVVDAYGWQTQVEVRKAPAVITARDLRVQRCIIAVGGTGAAPEAVSALAKQTGRESSLVWTSDAAKRPATLFLNWQPAGNDQLPADPLEAPTPLPSATPLPPTPNRLATSTPTRTVTPPSRPLIPPGYPGEATPGRNVIQTPVSGYQAPAAPATAVPVLPGSESGSATRTATPAAAQQPPPAPTTESGHDH